MNFVFEGIKNKLLNPHNLKRFGNDYDEMYYGKFYKNWFNAIYNKFNY